MKDSACVGVCVRACVYLACGILRVCARVNVIVSKECVCRCRSVCVCVCVLMCVVSEPFFNVHAKVIL